MNVKGILHVNINCSDFERSRQFYEMLGFRVIMPVLPDGSGEVAAAVGMDSYHLRGALMRHRDGFVLDLLEWRTPRDEQPPYDRLNHLGLARMAFITRDLDADMVELAAAGVKFLSDDPAQVSGPDGGATRFICFRDPDGTVLELVEMAADGGEAGSKQQGP